MKKIRPLGDHVAIRPQKDPDQTASGLYLPDSAKKRPQRGEVLAVGPGRLNEAGTGRIPMQVQPGQVVAYGWVGSTMTVDGEDLLVIKESDILGVIE